jgi:hypothetical protein
MTSRKTSPSIPIGLLLRLYAQRVCEHVHCGIRLVQEWNGKAISVEVKEERNLYADTLYEAALIRFFWDLRKIDARGAGANCGSQAPLNKMLTTSSRP